MRRQSASARFLSVVAAIVALSACDTPSADSPSASKVGKQTHGFTLWESPRALRPLAFQDENGRALSLQDFRGKVLVLNVWATWCGPCREEMPTLDALQAKLGGPDLEVLALSVDQAGPNAVRKFFADIGVKHLRLYIDPSAKTLNTLDVLGLPTTLLVDRQGRERGRLIGIAKWDSPAMVKFLQEVIEQTRGNRS